MGEARFGRVGPRALNKEAFLLAYRHAAGVLTAEPAVPGPGADILATGIGTYPDVAAAHVTRCSGAGEQLLRARGNYSSELVYEVIEKAVERLRHCSSRVDGRGLELWLVAQVLYLLVSRSQP